MVGKKNCPSYFLHEYLSRFKLVAYQSICFNVPDFQRVYCVYIAPDEQTIKTHAERGEFPANSIAEIKTMIDPTTAENS
jgi:hypothetical protein